MRVRTLNQFDRDVAKAPAPVREWALDWVAVAEKPDATLAEIEAGAPPMKGGEFRGCRVRKWRRKFPHGEYRLLFRTGDDEVLFFALRPRGDAYKVAARRLRAV